MGKQTPAIDYNKFRSLCLRNAEDALKTAEGLVNKGVNHIAFHLTILCLEEIGKVFLGWTLLNQKEEWGKEKWNAKIDDHVRKLFWAIWGPTFMRKVITNDEIEKIRGLATLLHETRLNALYTDLPDTVAAAEKIPDEELARYQSMARARLVIAKDEGDMGPATDQDDRSDILWFAKASDDPLKRNFIFGQEGQQKLIDLGNVVDWIKWLKERFDKEAEALKKILDEELKKSVNDKSKKSKWKIRFRLTSHSHSIRANVLTRFNNESTMVKLSRGDVQTLIVDLILNESVPVQSLYHYGWLVAKTFVGALNVGTNGFIYWNLPVDTDRYYEKIWDLENNKEIVAALATGLRLNWEDRKLSLSEQELGITALVLAYFTQCYNTRRFEAIDFYLMGMAMFAKTDIHFGMEAHCFFQFFRAFERAIRANENVNDDFDIKVEGLKQLGAVLVDPKAFEDVLDIGIAMSKGAPLPRPVTLAEVISMKQYSGQYFVTLALRLFHKDSNIKLTLLEEQEKDSEKETE